MSSKVGSGRSTRRPQPGPSIIYIGVRIGAALVVIIVFVLTTFFVHNQLGLQSDNSKLYITNQISKVIPHGAIDAIKHIHIEQFPGVVSRLEESVYNELEQGRKDIEYYLNNMKHTFATEPPTPPPTPSPTPPPVAPLEHTLNCPHADLVKFWKPATKKDLQYKTPYLEAGPSPKYVTFEPDVGGWNNIRMQMETVLVLAAATGRILVLPPDQPMYLLNQGKGHQKAHSFADFFPFDLVSKRVPVISMKEFMEREGIAGNLRSKRTGAVSLPPKNKTEFIGTDRDDRLSMWEYLREVAFCPLIKGMKQLVVIPPGPGVNVSLWQNASEYEKKLNVFAAGREPVFYNTTWINEKVIHFISKPGDGYRILEHFYVFIHFQDSYMERHYKRFVRDFVHYVDVISCKAAIIINKLKEEGKGVYSSFHIRRGEFQYKVVKIPADQILANVGPFIPANHTLYIATDEKNMTFFKPFFDRHPAVRFLKDYIEIAKLGDLNPNYLGMIDAIVCTRGEFFVGTWFSTFSGYITRMRGYMGYHDHTVWYGDKGHRDRFQHDELPMFPFYMREWNVSWADIDDEI